VQTVVRRGSKVPEVIVRRRLMREDDGRPSRIGGSELAELIAVDLITLARLASALGQS
jgi:hypothetical protein